MSSQLEDAFNEAVERRTAELRAALEFYANADNYVGGEVGWWADAPGGEQRWCMDFGSIARSALGSDRPPFFTAQQERALARCEGYEEGIAAASPDERLREAVRDARDHAYLALQVGVPHDRIIDHLRDIWEACSAALAAADREAPDEAGRICCRGMGADGGCNICAAEATR